MMPVGALIIGLLAQAVGSCKVIMIAAILHTTSWLVFYNATNSAMLLVAQAMVGLTYSVAFGPGCTYIAEISQPHLRSTLMATNNLFVLTGSFFTVLLAATSMHYRTIALVNVSIPIIGFVIIYFIPESPQWLASKHIPQVKKFCTDCIRQLFEKMVVYNIYTSCVNLRKSKNKYLARQSSFFIPRS